MSDLDVGERDSTPEGRGISQNCIFEHPQIAVGSASQCYWDDLMIFKCEPMLLKCELILLKCALMLLKCELMLLKSKINTKKFANIVLGNDNLK